LVAFVGAMVLLTGAAMLIPLGLGLLAVEFVCVRRWLRNARKLWRTQK
jgi:hypothetical protein